MTDVDTIRRATLHDVADLTTMSDRLVVAGIDWTKNIGDGETISSPLTLIAQTSTGEIAGFIGVRPTDISSREVINNRNGRKTDFTVDDLPWWKLSALGVVEKHRGSGLARDLLLRVVDTMPNKIVGLYGNVEERRHHEIAWYRRQGFYISKWMALPPSEDAKEDEADVLVRPEDETVMFRGYKPNLTAHLGGNGDPQAENRAADAAFESLIRRESTPTGPSNDVGYRTHALRVAEKTKTVRCIHATIDDVQVSWAAIPEQHLIVFAGLCQRCRSLR